MKTERESFFDTLIDQIVTDVRRDIERSYHPQSPLSPAPDLQNPVASDLISKVLDFKSRIARFDRQLRSYSPSGRKTNPPPTRARVAAVAAQGVTWIEIDSAEGELALATLLQLGAQFTVRERPPTKCVSRLDLAALERERRRLILLLHPDRAVQSALEIKKAQDRFVQAAHAFDVLLNEGPRNKTAKSAA